MAAGSLYGVAASEVALEFKKRRLHTGENFFKRRGGGGSILIKGRDKKHGIPKLFSKRNKKNLGFNSTNVA